jgi:hypothetical protein
MMNWESCGGGEIADLRICWKVAHKPVWSDPRGAMKLMVGSWNESSRTAVAFVQMRLMVVSH